MICKAKGFRKFGAQKKSLNPWREGLGLRRLLYVFTVYFTKMLLEGQGVFWVFILKINFESLERF